MRNVTKKSFIIGLFFFCGWSFADYLNPPDWAGSLDFTHQSWDFSYPEALEPNGPSLPVPPDGDPNWTNLFGEPCLVDVQFSDYPTFIPGIVGWMWDYPTEGLETVRRGYWGGMGNVSLTFKIPNKQRQPLWQKQIWIQMIYLARKDGGKTYDIAVATDPNFTDANEPQLAYVQLDELAEPEGNVSKWYRLTAAYTLASQPQAEYVRLTANHLPIDASPPVGGAAMVDQVDIDTRAVNPNFIDVIDFKDYAALAAQYRQSSVDFDLCPDGHIDLKDLSIFFDSWLKQGSTP